jgi:hypothetical protein
LEWEDCLEYAQGKHMEEAPAESIAETAWQDHTGHTQPEV